MSAQNPQTFAVPSTGFFKTADGKQSFYFTEGTIIPMYLAIAMGMPGAGYTPVTEFSSAQQAAIITLIEQNSPGGGGTPATYPLGQFFDSSSYGYDSSTVYPAVYDTLIVTVDDTYVLPFVAFRPSEFVNASVNVTSGSAGTVTGCLYSAWPNVPQAEYPETPGYPGVILLESTSEPDTSSNGLKTMTFPVDTFIDPGLYYLAVQFSGTPTVTSIQPTSAGRYTRGGSALYTGGFHSGTTYGTFGDPFDHGYWGLYEDKMPRVSVSLIAQAV